MANDLILALDIGTTSAKAVMFDLNGNVIAEAEQKITTEYPQKGWVEQDPVAIEDRAVKAIREVMDHAAVDRTHVIGLGISCAMHSLICIGAEGEALSRALIWSDARSFKQAEKLIGSGLYERTGTPPHPMSPLAKLMWMQENEFGPYHEATYFMSVKEYLINKWFNTRVIDYSMAAATGLFNFKRFRWDGEALSLAGVSPKQLSRIVPPTEILRGINLGKAAEMGLSPDLPFVIGAADGQLANLGSGAIFPGEVAITVGTSGAIRQMTPGPHLSEQAETFSYPFTKELAISGGPTNNGGIVLDWLRNIIGYDGTFAELIAEAATAEIGAAGLLFHPYINGERAPLWNSKATGNLFGLAMIHQRTHLVRAVLEGMTYNLYHINELLNRETAKTTRIYVNGGLARSAFWVEMLADVFNTEVHVSESHHNAAWGAAWTALVALKKVASFADIKQHIPIKAIIQPDYEKHEQYKRVYKKYRALGEGIGTYYKE